MDLTQLQASRLPMQEIQDPDTLAYLVTAALGMRQGAGSPLRQLTDYLAGQQALLHDPRPDLVPIRVFRP